MISRETEKFLTRYYNEFKALLYSLFVYLEISWDIAKILFVLMALDTFFGIITAFTLKEKFSMPRLAHGAMSKLSILVVPMILTYMGKALKYDFSWFANTFLDILVVSEGISIFTNIISIRKKKRIKNVDFITSFINALRLHFTKIAKTFIESLSKKDV